MSAEWVTSQQSDGLKRSQSQRKGNTVSLRHGRSRSGPSPRTANMKTVGEIESAVCTSVARFEQEYMGRGPKDIHAHLIGDMLIVRLKGVLTGAEQNLVRTQLIETARQSLEAIVWEITGSATISLHHDISTLAGEEIIVFVLAEAPIMREAKRK